MKVVHKFVLPEVPGRNELRIEAGATLLTAQLQQGQLCVWATVDLAVPPRTRVLWVVGTGRPFDHNDLRHVGTVQDGGLVWHVFDAGPTL